MLSWENAVGREILHSLPVPTEGACSRPSDLRRGQRGDLKPFTHKIADRGKNPHAK